METPNLAPPSMAAVFQIPELLEAILFQLDMVTLLVAASRVSKAWSGIIDASPALQQKLFFQPVARQIDPPEMRADNMDDVNPLLIKRFGRLFFEHAVVANDQTNVFWRRAAAFTCLPWCKASAASTDLDHPRTKEGDLKFAKRDFNLLPHDPLERERFTRRNASWRRMLVSQPPPPFIGFFTMVSQLLPDAPYQTGKILPRTGPGVRMDDLYDLLQHHLGHAELDTKWTRVTWKRQHGYDTSKSTKKACAEVLRETTLLVEVLQNLLLRPWDPNPPSEERVRSFDAAFRCDGFREPNLEDVMFHEHDLEIPATTRYACAGYLSWHRF